MLVLIIVITDKIFAKFLNLNRLFDFPVQSRVFEGEFGDGGNYQIFQQIYTGQMTAKFILILTNDSSFGDFIVIITS